MPYLVGQQRVDVRVPFFSFCLAICSYGGPILESSLALGTPDRRWCVRVYCAGREVAARQERQKMPHHVEHYLTQFWPVEA